MARTSSQSGSRIAILAALGANLGIAIAKFIGFLITGASSMLAETVHSLADTSNEVLLLFGQNRADQEADELHQFGYGRNRYFYSFVVALVIFQLGAVFAIVEGVNKIREPQPIESPSVAIVILGVAAVLEGLSLRTGVKEANKIRHGVSWWRFIRLSRHPELPVVLLEDFAALVGLLFALLAVGLSTLTGNPIWDGIGTLAIGSLLGAVAMVLIVEMKSLLIGEGALPFQEARIREQLPDGETIQRVIHLRTEFLGPDELLVAAKVAVRPGLEMAEVAAAIDAAEARLRANLPIVRLIYLEPDIDREPQDGVRGTDAL